MSNAESGFYHCGRCGALFGGPAGNGPSRRCPECGQDPVPPAKRKDSPPQTVGLPGDAAHDHTDASREGEVRHERGRRRKRTASSIRNLVAFLSIWILLLAGFAVAVKLRRSQAENVERERSNRYKEARRAQEAAGIDRPIEERERVFLNEVFPACQQCFTEFLSTTAPEARSQWVVGGPSMIGKMSRFHGTTSLFLPAEAPELEYVGVIETSEGPLVETLWKDKDNYRIEAVFRRDRNDWRLDWEGFTRFAEIPWPMFAAGAGDPLQEFRLLARQRLVGDRKNDLAISLVFYPPRFGTPSDVGTASPEFLIPRASENGRKLEALFALRAQGKYPLRAHVPAEDPDGMIRVRVRIRRHIDAQGTRRFELEEVLAGHWLAINDTGIPETPAEDEPAPEAK